MLKNEMQLKKIKKLNARKFVVLPYLFGNKSILVITFTLEQKERNS